MHWLKECLQLLNSRLNFLFNMSEWVNSWNLKFNLSRPEMTISSSSNSLPFLHWEQLHLSSHSSLKLKDYFLNSLLHKPNPIIQKILLVPPSICIYGIPPFFTTSSSTTLAQATIVFFLDDYNGLLIFSLLFPYYSVYPNGITRMVL